MPGLRMVFTVRGSWGGDVRVAPALTCALAIVALAGAACGDDEGDSAGVTDRTGVPSSGPTTDEVSSVPADESVAPATGGTDRVLLERCQDVPAITTDVVGDGTLGEMDPVFQGVLTTYAKEHVDTFGGRWIDRSAGGVVVMAFIDDPEPHLAELLQRRPSPDDIAAVRPPPEITDDRPLGEWGVALDVVQVPNSRREIFSALDDLDTAGETVPGGVAAYPDIRKNRVHIEPQAYVTEEILTGLTEEVLRDGLALGVVCWWGELVDEAPEPIDPGALSDVIVVPDEDGNYPAGTLATCEGLTFDLGALGGLTPLEEIDPGLQAVVEDWLGTGEGQFWEQEGWSLLYEDGESARMVSPDWSYIDAEMAANGWTWVGAGGGGDCDVRVPLPEELGEVEWTVSPVPEVSDTEIRVTATERDCASGEEMGDRLLDPHVVETDDVVWIALAVIQPIGGQECPSNPSTEVVIQLDEPLGDREIRDGLVIGSLTALLGS